MKRPEEARLLAHYERHPVYHSPLDHATPGQVFYAVGGLWPEPVLDLGCGDGRLARALPTGTSYHGVDYSEKRVAIAQERAPEGATFSVSDLWDFVEFDSAAWGTVVLVDVLEHLESPLKLLDMIRPACREILATVPINLPNPAHLHVWPHLNAVREFFRPDFMAEGNFGTHTAVMRWWPGAPERGVE